MKLHFAHWNCWDKKGKVRYTFSLNMQLFYSLLQVALGDVFIENYRFAKMLPENHLKEHHWKSVWHIENIFMSIYPLYPYNILASTQYAYARAMYTFCFTCMLSFCWLIDGKKVMLHWILHWISDYKVHSGSTYMTCTISMQY